MNQTPTLGASTLHRWSIALCCGLTLTAVGCVGSIGGGDTEASESATGSEGSTDNDSENKIAPGTDGAPGTVDAPGAGGAPGTDGTSSAGNTPCVYPAGDGAWTVEVGSTVPQALEWQGFAEHSSTESTVKMEDYLDCDGSKGINAVLLDTSAIWCGSCQYHASRLEQKMTSSWTAKGIRVITFMIQDRSGNPATIQNALAWKDAFTLDSSAVVADPDFAFAPPSGHVVLPMMVLVNPRNMQITAIPEHAQQADMLVEQLAASNLSP